MASDFVDSGVPFSKAHPILHTALQYGGIGAGVAATAALVRELKDAMDERDKEKKRRKVELSPGTIVLRVPKSRLKAMGDPDKYAEDLHAVSGGHETVSKVESSSDTEVDVMKNMASKAGVQRDVAGRFVSGSDVRVNPPVKKAEETGVGTRAAEILAAVGSLGGGYYLVDMLRQKLQQKRLKKQMEAAQNEYIDMMEGSSLKNAEAVNSMFLLDDACPEKTAGVRDTWRNMWDSGKNVSAGALALMLATALGSGYITKRVIEDKFDEPEEEEPELPKVNRILFKAYDDSPGGVKKAGCDEFEVTHEQVMATLGLLMDGMSSPGLGKEAADYSFLDKITSTDGGRQWLLDAYAKSMGLSRPDFKASGIPGLSALDKVRYARTLIGIRRNPGRHMPAVREHVMSIMRKDPKGWFALIGGDGNADLVERLAMDAMDMGMPSMPGAVKRIGAKVLTGTGAGRRRLESEFNKAIGLGGVKSASVLDLYEKLEEATANHRINRDRTNNDISAKLDRVLDRMDQVERTVANPGRKAKAKAKRKPTNDTGVDVVSDDDSEGFVVENGEGIARALNALKGRGLV